MLFHIDYSAFRPWDVAQIVPRDRISSSETFEGVLKGMKAMLYVLLIIGVWLSAMCSQGSLLLLTSALVKVIHILWPDVMGNSCVTNETIK